MTLPTKISPLLYKGEIERPKKCRKQFYSGKQKEHTLKTQLVIQQKTGQIICIVNGKGKTHDFKLF
ncbi:putative transposase, IS4 [Crocosphaera subtropica ATCC 51142]|uniref:Transposase, IS4 n=1 Tax=Crocosphaera subtropica (strain ATCC 51142 / BH68) TaxID=43989 RepID=B1X2Z6_CROS5|nr:putative transposase, IS4 [Crocosphaera subtropica ATCC 51142]